MGKKIKKRGAKIIFKKKFAATKKKGITKINTTHTNAWKAAWIFCGDQ